MYIQEPLGVNIKPLEWIPELTMIFGEIYSEKVLGWIDTQAVAKIRQELIRVCASLE